MDKKEAIKKNKNIGTRGKADIPRRQSTGLSRHRGRDYDPTLSMQRNIGNQLLWQMLASQQVQTKLLMGQPNDPYEQEANQVASQVMQAKEMGGKTPAFTPAMEPSIHGAGTGGQPMPEETSAFFGMRFGHDFSRVRIHSDGQAAESANSVQARAFTLGNHVVFAAGQYNPHSYQGRSLLAHELTHVIQQEGHPGMGIHRQQAPHPQISQFQPPHQTMINRELSWESIRNSAYEGLIDTLRSLQSSGDQQLRELATATLSGTQLTIANGLIDAFSVVTDIFVSLILAIVGLVVGFVAGIIQMIIGLIQLLIGIIQGILLFLYGFIDGGERFDRWANDVLDAIQAIPTALSALIDNWLRDFGNASTDRQTLMIAELFGQIIAIILTFEVAAARAGSAPRIVANLGRGGEGLSFAAAGETGAVLTETGVISLDVATPAVAVAMPGALAMSVPAEIESMMGEGPSRDAMDIRGTRGAGLARNPRHHIFPQEFRDTFFRDRGFNDIDDFCVRLEESHHQALHGGGNWRLGRTWPGEWNTRIMAELRAAERFMGRTLTRDEIITIGRELMVEYGIDQPFIRFR
jgi:Domain of unknown function (DUF4157)/Predicted lipoprotein of unknown function (DUF2380)